MGSDKSYGCWTCRLRRVRCDKATPACKACSSRHISCHGYGPQPKWMDGGRREHEERQRIKGAVKTNVKHSKRLQNQALRSQAHSQDQMETTDVPAAEGGVSSLPNSSTNSGAEGSTEATDSGTTRKSVTLELRLTKEALYPVTPPVPKGNTDTSPTSPFSRALPYDESELLMYYLDHVFPMQYPYHSTRTKSRGWLLWLLSKNGPLYRASLSLAALAQRLISSDDEGEDIPFEYHASTLRELQDFIGAATTDGLPSGDELFVEVLACGAALVSFEVFMGGTDNWQPHLHATVSILNTIDSRLTSQRSNGVDATLAFHAHVLLWMDLLSCVSTCRKPQLPYNIWLASGDKFNLVSIMGCQNWAMKAIGDLATLNEWKMENLATGTFRVGKFITKSQMIEDGLENEIEALHLTAQASSATTVDKAVTLMFATAALVQLHTIATNVLQPRPSRLRRLVARVMHEAQRASGIVSVRQIIWPICVTGCVAEPHQQSFFEGKVMEVLDKPDGTVGNCQTALEIMRNCWAYRIREPEVHWDCSKTLTRMGVSALLI